MPRVRKHVLVIGGFDPSGGAGVLADIKALEQHKVYGMAINTANTVQNDSEFLNVNWVDEKLVEDQLDILLKQYTFQYAKIGLVPSVGLLKKWLDKLSHLDCKIIWDPVLKASAGFDFGHDAEEMKSVLSRVFLLTPNWYEIKQIAGKDGIEGAKELSEHCHVFLKGGHNEDDPGRDYLVTASGIQNFRSKIKTVSPKHGSGCVLASAITANLANDYNLSRSCLRAKQYVERFLTSNDTLLGYHKR